MFFGNTSQNTALQLANRHKTLRKDLGFTQAEIAERSGVSLGSIKRFETTGKISLESLLKLTEVLGRLSEFEQIFVSDIDPKIENLFSNKTK
jgi:transcriptional regulator with XRE-family HTH domain